MREIVPRNSTKGLKNYSLKSTKTKPWEVQLIVSEQSIPKETCRISWYLNFSPNNWQFFCRDKRGGKKFQLLEIKMKLLIWSVIWLSMFSILLEGNFTEKNKFKNFNFISKKKFFFTCIKFQLQLTIPSTLFG